MVQKRALNPIFRVYGNQVRLVAVRHPAPKRPPPILPRQRRLVVLVQRQNGLQQRVPRFNVQRERVVRQQPCPEQLLLPLGDAHVFPLVQHLLPPLQPPQPRPLLRLRHLKRPLVPHFQKTLLFRRTFVPPHDYFARREQNRSGFE